jgi:hypothetical protein
MDSKKYDLSNGALFFVTTKGGKTEVTQLSRDLQVESIGIVDMGLLSVAVTGALLAAVVLSGK